MECRRRRLENALDALEDRDAGFDLGRPEVPMAEVLLDRRVEALQDGLASIETPMPTAGQCAAPPAITGWS